MQIRRADTGIVYIALRAEEVAAVRDDLGQIAASKISNAGDKMHSLLESASTECCPEPSYGSYLAHKKRGEDACEASKAKKREYDRKRYARDPHKGRAPQRAYEARKRAATA